MPGRGASPFNRKIIMPTIQQAALIPINSRAIAQHDATRHPYTLFAAAAEAANLRVGYTTNRHMQQANPEDIITDAGDQSIDVILAHRSTPVHCEYVHAEATHHGVYLEAENIPNTIAQAHPSIPFGTDEFIAGRIVERIVYLPCTPTEHNEQWVSIIADALRMAADDDIARLLAAQTEQALVDTLTASIERSNTHDLTNIDGELRTKRERLATLRSSVDQTEADLRELMIRRHAAHIASRKPVHADPDAIKTAIQNIRALSNVADLYADTTSNDLIVVTTTLPLHVTMNDGERFSETVGPFELRLNFTDTLIRAINIDPGRPNPDMDHPHVEAGNMCLGGVRELVKQLMTNCQFDVATQVLIDQLTHVNPNDCFYGQWWDDFFPGQLDHYYDHYEDEEYEE